MGENVKNLNTKVISTLILAATLQSPIAAQAKPFGAIAGGAIGAALGNQIGGGNGKIIATAAGAVAGAVIGNELTNEKKPEAPTPQVVVVQSPAPVAPAPLQPMPQQNIVVVHHDVAPEILPNDFTRPVRSNERIIGTNGYGESHYGTVLGVTQDGSPVVKIDGGYEGGWARDHIALTEGCSSRLCVGQQTTVFNGYNEYKSATIKGINFDGSLIVQTTDGYFGGWDLAHVVMPTQPAHEEYTAHAPEYIQPVHQAPALVPPPSPVAYEGRSFYDLSVGDRVVVIRLNREAKIVGQKADGSFTVKILKTGKIMSNLSSEQLAAEHGSKGELSVSDYVVETNSNREAHILAIYSSVSSGERQALFVLKYMDNGQIQSGWDSAYFAK